MNDAVNVRMFIEDIIKSSFIGDIYIVKEWTFSTDQFDAVDTFLGGIVKIVDDDDLVVSLQEGKCSERSNISSPSTSV